ncbi:hypothetical protein GOP47_0020491 [Adiantum capillus-veneris]|uniref:TMC domain-containing protein n=1 Tax=Adiantum capillus-veneris TaxID=13818 RepID=A0A9D4Z8R2_ADICA|nr:hypothetical protein GOP47_0020491 [Adiantum capillus-veneris]
MPGGHSSKHPTALDIAGSSISIIPVIQDDMYKRPMNQVPSPAKRPSQYRDQDDNDEPFSSSSYRGSGRRYRSSSTDMSVLDPPSLSVPPLYRAATRSSNSADHRGSKMESVYRAETELSATVPSSLPARSSLSYNEHDGFLDERRAQAAAHYLSPNDQNMDAIYKRRVQVEYAVGRAKERIAQLGLKCPSQKHHGKGCMATIMRQFKVLKDSPFWGLWGEQLKEIEGNFGSAVMITFAFLRWVFLLNFCLSILWVGAIVVPFFLHPPSSYQWKGIKQYFKANGLEKTWILLGGYFYKSEQTGWYRVDYMYPCAIATMYLISLVAILATLYVILQSGYLSAQGLFIDACTENSKCPRDGFLCCNSPSDGEWSTCLTQPIGYCASKCMENEVGEQILKLIITSTVINSTLDIGVGAIFAFLLNKQQELSIPDFAIDIVYLQVLVWTGSHFSPLASTIGVLCYLLTFYSKKITLKSCTSTQKLYSASRTSVLTYGVLLVALVLCVVPEAVFVTTPSSGVCGPIKVNQSMYNVVALYIGKAGNPMGVVLEWLGSPVILCGVIILLVFVVVLLKAKLVQSYQYLEMRTKEQTLDSVGATF